MHRSTRMVPRGIPSSQQPIRGYAGHAQPVGSERKCGRVAPPVPSDSRQRSEGSCVPRRRGKTGEKARSLPVKKEKRESEHLPSGGPEPRDWTKESYVAKTSQLSDGKKNSLLTLAVVVHANASSVPNWLTACLSSGELLRGPISACSAVIHRATVRNVLFSCSGALFPLFSCVLKESSGDIKLIRVNWNE